jgi:hypothetical protein
LAAQKMHAFLSQGPSPGFSGARCTAKLAVHVNIPTTLLKFMSIKPDLGCNGQCCCLKGGCLYNAFLGQGMGSGFSGSSRTAKIAVQAHDHSTSLIHIPIKQEEGRNRQGDCLEKCMHSWARVRARHFQALAVLPNWQYRPTAHLH